MSGLMQAEMSASRRMASVSQLSWPRKMGVGFFFKDQLSHFFCALGQFPALFSKLMRLSWTDGLSSHVPENMRDVL